MLLETAGIYNIEKLREKYSRYMPKSSTDPFGKESVLTDNQKIALFTLIVIYAFVTIYVSIRYPIAGNVLLSFILAVFFSSIFWFIKIVEILYYSIVKLGDKRKNKKNKRKNKKNKGGKNKKNKGGEKYIGPIY